ILSTARNGCGKEIYAGSTTGLYTQSTGGTFSPVTGISGVCWSLLSTNDSVMAATELGIYLVKNLTVKRISKRHSYVLTQSRLEPNRIWAGTRDGLIALSNVNGRWQEEHRFKLPTKNIRTIIEENKGRLWLGTLDGKVITVDFPVTGKIEVPEVKQYGQSYGLPIGEIHVFLAAGHTIFATLKGLFRFDHHQKKFIPDVTLGPEFTGGPDGRHVFHITESKNKTI
ncbi:MAG: hypothetical protein GY940_45610, partial [bacterium]|nr:hypothetical protein [bacterium]